MYMELYDLQNKLLAMVYRSDVDGSFEVYLHDEKAPRELTDKFVQQAKAELTARAETYNS